MGKMILSCGHEDPRKPFGWVMLFPDEDGHTTGLMSGSYCTMCFAARILCNPEETWTLDQQKDAEEVVFG